eukprot:10037916-Heterocapsa_arctica.AAC.1
MPEHSGMPSAGASRRLLEVFRAWDRTMSVPAVRQALTRPEILKVKKDISDVPRTGTTAVEGLWARERTLPRILDMKPEKKKIRFKK